MEPSLLQAAEFWQLLDTLVCSSHIVIDRPKGCAHPRYPDLLYPMDYGYLQDTGTVDGSGLDVWLGSDERRQLDAIICTVDTVKRDVEIKLLIGCTQEEKQLAYQVHNRYATARGLLILR